jgi:Ca2+-binding EF-hand superfamily protein
MLAVAAIASASATSLRYKKESPSALHPTSASFKFAGSDGGALKGGDSSGPAADATGASGPAAGTASSGASGATGTGATGAERKEVEIPENVKVEAHRVWNDHICPRLSKGPDCVVTQPEFVSETMKEHPAAPEETEIQTAKAITTFKMIDLDGSGDITFDEFARDYYTNEVMEKLKEDTEDLQAKKAQAEADEKKSNPPTCDELYKMMNRGEDDGKISKEEARPYFGDDENFDAGFDSLDTNLDGGISLKECKEWRKSFEEGGASGASGASGGAASGASGASGATGAEA